MHQKCESEFRDPLLYSIGDPDDEVFFVDEDGYLRIKGPSYVDFETILGWNVKVTATETSTFDKLWDSAIITVSGMPVRNSGTFRRLVTIWRIVGERLGCERYDNQLPVSNRVLYPWRRGYHYLR